MLHLVAFHFARQRRQLVVHRRAGRRAPGQVEPVRGASAGLYDIPGHSG